MKLPFTLEQFLEVFKNYNQAVFPMQVLLYLVSGVAIYLAIRKPPATGKIISIMLSFLWLWMGIVYQLYFFTSINKAAYLFGGLFIIQGFLFLVFGVFQNKLSFHFKNNIYGITGMSMVLYALIIYPVSGYFVGHIYPSSPTFGLPCPTTIFTFGMLLINIKKCPVALLIIPFIWSVIGFTAAFKLGMLEDTALIAAGLIATALLVYRNNSISKNKQVVNN